LNRRYNYLWLTFFLSSRRRKISLKKQSPSVVCKKSKRSKRFKSGGIRKKPPPKLAYSKSKVGHSCHRVVVEEAVSRQEEGVAKVEIEWREGVEAAGVAIMGPEL
jgi:hypothetical protein